MRKLAGELVDRNSLKNEMFSHSSVHLYGQEVSCFQCLASTLTDNRQSCLRKIENNSFLGTGNLYVIALYMQLVDVISVV